MGIMDWDRYQLFLFFLFHFIKSFWSFDDVRVGIGVDGLCKGSVEGNFIFGNRVEDDSTIFIHESDGVVARRLIWTSVTLVFLVFVNLAEL